MDSPRSAVVGGGGRVFFRDVKPYAIVDRLDQLRGPAGGTVELSHSVLWAPGGRLVDLDRPGALRMAYRAVLNEGTVEDLVRVLNRDVRIAVWPDLLLPLRVLAMWESRFPELRSSAAVWARTPGTRPRSGMWPGSRWPALTGSPRRARGPSESTG